MTRLSLMTKKIMLAFLWFSVSDWEVDEKILANLDSIISKVSLMNLEVKGLL